MRETRQQTTEVAVINLGDARYPEEAMRLLGDSAPERTWAMGNLDLLAHPLLALFCSSKCPGSVILQTYDAVCALRDAGVGVIGGFHSPIEKECLRLLLRGAQPIVICPARSIEHIRVPTEWKAPLSAGRLLILSPFDAKHRRITADNAAYRNRFAAALAARILIPHAAPGSKTEVFMREVEGWGKEVVTLGHALSGSLVELGNSSGR
jgi:predicted Rossmann fold nucleotide-binding protein DprA/Smf involved in DNA uptake